MRTRVLCDLFFTYRDSISTIPDEKLDKVANEWASHLEISCKSHQVYRSSIEQAKITIRTSISVHIHFADLSYDYAR